MILVSGLPATGKTTFSEWLSSEICIPLLSRDRVLEKYVEIAKVHCEYEEQRGNVADNIPAVFLGHSIPALLFWFFCEEIMKSSSALIIETVFTNQMKETIGNLIEKYKYQTVNVHLDASVEIKRHRINERSPNKKISLENLKKAHESEKIKDAKNFRYGNCIIYVDTTDFSMVSYKDISEQIRQFILRNV